MIQYLKGGEAVKKKLKLDFSSERKIKLKKTRAFIISFAAFVLVLGSISLLIFMKSINFDFSNLKPDVSNNTTTTELHTDSKSLNLTGYANLILICTDNKNQLISLSFINCDIDNNKISLLQIPANDTVTFNGTNQSFENILSKNGADALKKAVSDYLGLSVDRFIKVNESELKKIIAKTGDVTVNVPKSIDYKSSEYSLLLDAGNQSLTADMFCKYLIFCENDQKGDAIVCYLNTLLSTKNIPLQDNLFNYIVNNSNTDITIVDYTNSSETITAYIQSQTGQRINKVNQKSELIGANNEK